MCTARKNRSRKPSPRNDVSNPTPPSRFAAIADPLADSLWITMLDLPPKNGNANEKPPITNQINILALMKATAIRKKLEKQGVHKVVIDAYLAGQMELIKEYFGELLAGGGGVVRVEDQAFGELLAGGGGVVRVEDQDFGERKQKKEKEEGGEGAAGDEDVDEKVEGGEVSAGGEPVDEKVKGEAADREGDGGRKDAA